MNPSFFKRGLSYFAAIVIGGAATFAGTATFTAQNAGVVQSVSQAFTSSASSQALCSIQNTSGYTRTLDSVDLLYATSTLTSGSVRLHVSVANTGATTGTPLLYDNTVSVPVSPAITTTSTLFTAKTAVSNGQYVNFMIASPTSTLSGRCQATWHN